MIKRIFLIMLLFSATISFSQDLMDQLKTSVERAEGGSGPTVVYTIFLTPTNAKSYYAKDYDSGNLVEINGKPIYFELSKKVGDEQENIVINVESASYIELVVRYAKGGYRYEFKFYY